MSADRMLRQEGIYSKRWRYAPEHAPKHPRIQFIQQAIEAICDNVLDQTALISFFKRIQHFDQSNVNVSRELIDHADRIFPKNEAYSHLIKPLITSLHSLRPQLAHYLEDAVAALTNQHSMRFQPGLFGMGLRQPFGRKPRQPAMKVEEPVRQFVH